MPSNKPAYWWCVPIGIACALIQMRIFYLRFGELNKDFSLSGYALFFASGLGGGLILIALLRSSASRTARRIVIAAFLLAAPLAILSMLGAGPLGPAAVLFVPLLPWAIIMGIAFFLGQTYPEPPH